MNIVKRANSYTCIRCRYRQSSSPARFRKNDNLLRGFAQSTDLPHGTSKDEESKSTSEAKVPGQAEGRMSGRLAQMTDEMIERDRPSAQKAIEDGGFSEELKKKLEARLQETSFRSENAAAFAQASLPVRPCYPFILQASGIYTHLVQCRQRNPRHCRRRALGRH